MEVIIAVVILPIAAVILLIAAPSATIASVKISIAVALNADNTYQQGQCRIWGEYTQHVITLSFMNANSKQ